jgi:MoxR-like ATPase
VVNNFRLYEGNGQTISDRHASLPLFDRPTLLDDAAGYVADPGLRDAVNVALALGQPLLVTGEPGTGKTKLADSVAHELNLAPPLVFHTKTTSTARDLFYRYDAIMHFHEAQFSQFSHNLSAVGTTRHVAAPGLSADRYIHYEALGTAILLAMTPADANPFLEPEMQNRGPVRSVVLIDELDKAPRDLPNDVLHEIENMSFTVHETGRVFTADPRYRPILILTSNSEKNLPDAFVRRCVYYHLSFPDAARLKIILEKRIGRDSRFSPEMLKHAVDRFYKIRELGLKKKPATAEFLAWVRILTEMELDVDNLKPGQADALALSYSVLAKDREDLEHLQQAHHAQGGA